MPEKKAMQVLSRSPFSNIDIKVSFPGASFQVLTQRPFVTVDELLPPPDDMHRNSILGGTNLSHLLPVMVAAHNRSRAGKLSKSIRMTRMAYLRQLRMTGRCDEPSKADSSNPLPIRLGGKVNYFCSLATPDGEPATAESLGLSYGSPLYLTVPKTSMKGGILVFETNEFMLTNKDPLEEFRRSDELPLSPLAAEVLQHARMCMSLFAPSSRNMLQKMEGDQRSIADISALACAYAGKFGDDAITLHDAALVFTVPEAENTAALQTDSETELFTIVVNIILAKLDFLAINRMRGVLRVEQSADPFPACPAFDALRKFEDLPINDALANTDIKPSQAIDILRIAYFTKKDQAWDDQWIQAVQEMTNALAAHDPAADDADLFVDSLFTYLGGPITSASDALVKIMKLIHTISFPPSKWVNILSPATASAIRDELVYKKPTFARSPLFVGTYQTTHPDGSVEVRHQA